MPIALQCDCGRALNVKNDLAGKKIRCPDCKSILAVPRADEEPNDLPLEVLPADEPPERSAGRRSRAAIQAEPPEPRPARRRSDDEDEDRPIRKRSKPRREIERRAPLVAFEPGWFGSVNSGVVGGLLMILIAVVWFIGGLAVGYIFYYPPILLVIGLIAIVKGLGNS